MTAVGPDRLFAAAGFGLPPLLGLPRRTGPDGSTPGGRRPQAAAPEGWSVDKPRAVSSTRRRTRDPTCGMIRGAISVFASDFPIMAISCALGCDHSQPPLYHRGAPAGWRFCCVYSRLHAVHRWFTELSDFRGCDAEAPLSCVAVLGPGGRTTCNDASSSRYAEARRLDG